MGLKWGGLRARIAQDPERPEVWTARGIEASPRQRGSRGETAGAASSPRSATAVELTLPRPREDDGGIHRACPFAGRAAQHGRGSFLRSGAPPPDGISPSRRADRNGDPDALRSRLQPGTPPLHYGSSWLFVWARSCPARRPGNLSNPVPSLNFASSATRPRVSRDTSYPSPSALSAKSFVRSSAPNPMFPRRRIRDGYPRSAHSCPKQS